MKQMLAQARALDGFKKLLGDDHVGIDIEQRQWGSNALKSTKRLHAATLKRFRTRGKRPLNKCINAASARPQYG